MWVNESWQGCLQEYTVAYDGKPTRSMVAAAPHALVSQILGTGRVLEHLVLLLCRIHIKFARACALIWWYCSYKRKEQIDCLLTDCSKLPSSVGLGLQTFVWLWLLFMLCDCIEYYWLSYIGLAQLHLNLSCGFQSLETKFLKLFRCLDFEYPNKHLLDYLNA